MHYMKRPRSNDEPRLLPMDYRAGENVVMIGRGRRCIFNEGNKRFRVMVKAELQAYSAGRKAKKSSIIKRILREINSGCDGGVGFVKQDAMTGRYYTATTTAAKVTIAQAFRDALHDIGYKSSKQHKQFIRDIARGKVGPGCAPPRVCSGCNQEVDLAGGEGCPKLKVPPESTAPARVVSAETSLKFWGDSVDPSVWFEHNHPSLREEQVHHLCEGGACDVAEKNHHHCGTRGAADPPGAMLVQEADPFAPIPLDDAMDTTGGGATWNVAPSMAKGGEDSESSDSSHALDDTDDEDDHAMVVWATEFVHCPRCSLVQGRGDFEDLPIHDIRKALIG